jgi:outer membrane autotransporter protein
VTDDGIGVKDTALVDYSLLFPANDVVLRMTVDFDPSGLAKEKSGVGQHLNDIFKGGGPDKLEPLALALLKLPTVDDVANAYIQLSGENYRALPISTLYASEQFSTDMMSCAARDGTLYAFIDENQCLYARVRFRKLEVDANDATTGFDEDAIAITGGAQWTMSGPWHVGVALGYEDSEIDIDTVRLNSDGDRFHAGATLKYINGPWFVAGAVSGGFTNYDSVRRISFPGFSSVARSDQDVTDIGGQLRAAYLMSQGSWYFKPMVDLNVVNVDLDSFTETGSSAALKVSGSDETVFSATPALEIGTQTALSGGTLVRPYLRGGVSFYSDADFDLAAGFAAAPGVAPFRTSGEIDDVVGNVSAGVSLLGVRGGVLTFSYDGSFGEDLEEHSISAKASMRF